MSDNNATEDNAPDTNGPKSHGAQDPEAEPKTASMTKEEEQIILERLRDLGYVD